MTLAILYEDPDLVIVSKPAGLPSHATLDPKRPHLQGQLEDQLQRSLTLHHRLDRDTTGCVLFSKTAELNSALSEMFRSREVEKTYLALVEGEVHKEPWSVRNHLKRRSRNRPEMEAVRSGGDFAWTDFVTLQARARHSLVQAQPQTGRTHQIRVHLQLSGCPIVGDDLYGPPNPPDRLMLHASQLRLRHPRTRQDLVVEAPLPESWKPRARAFGLHL